MVVLHGFSEGKCIMCERVVVTAHIPCNKVCPVCSENMNMCEICGAKIEDDEQADSK